jgi:autotransporter-associated beta strand protein/T5SS/PEP-CTERM-associated repeat protein
MLGANGGGVGTAAITGGTWANSGDLVVGSGGRGRLTMLGGLVTVGGALSKGIYGTINLQPGGTLQIGTGGTTGVLATDLTNNGTLVFDRSDTSTYAGVLSGTGSLVKLGAGTLNLTGTSSTTARLTAAPSVLLDMAVTASSGVLQILSGTGELIVGSTTAGSLSVVGGSVNTWSSSVGVAAGSVGIATVSSGTWANSNSVWIGSSGTGTLAMTGGSVTAWNSYLGNGAGGTGLATVSGGTWASIGGTLNVGYSGAGTLNVTGGNVNGRFGTIGRNANGSGTATVSSGTWASSDSLWVGESGLGRLNVTGGSVTSGSASVGLYAGSDGMAAVSSGTWANSGNLVVAGSGTGTLTMTGGLVSVGGTLSKGTYGTVNLQPGGTLQIGTGGTTGVLATDLTNNGTLVFNRADSLIFSGTINGSGTILKRGSGTLTFTGTAINTNAVVFNQPLRVEDGTVSVGDGALRVLRFGSADQTGSLYVEGGQVFNNDGWLGADTDGKGFATVTSGTWSNRRYLNVGAFGTGTLLLQGGMVTGSTASIAWQASSTGVATVTGGTWSNADEMRLGDAGNGTLRIQGGKVENGGDLSVGRYGTALLQLTSGTLTDRRTRIGYYATGTGSAEVDGGEWMNNDFFYVGVFGSGRLRLTGGVIRNSYAIAGYDLGSDGNIEVSGGKWLSSDFLIIGRKGTAAMTITDGYVENTDGVVGYYAEGSGAVLIAGGTWANSGNLYVGLSGTGTLTMNGGLVTVGGILSKGTYGTINLSPGGTLQIGTGGTTGALATDLTNNGTLVFDRSDDLAFEGVLGGVGMVSKQGAGTLTLKGANAYSGGTRVSGGIIRAESDGAIGTGTVILADSAKRLVLGDGVTVVNNITIDQPVGEVGSGAIQYEGTGTATIASGTITVLAQSITGGEFGSRNGGTLIVESPIIASGTQRVSVRTGTVVFSGGGVYSRFTLHSTAQLGRTDGLSSAAVISMNATQSSNSSIFDLAGYNQTLVGLVNRAVGSAVIANSSTTRNSTLTLTGSSTYSGIIQDTVAGGTKQMCLAVDGGWLGLTNANTMSGSTTVKNGTLQLGHLNALPYSEVSVLAGGTLSLAPGLMTTVGGLKRVGSGVVDVGNGLITVAEGLSAFNLYVGLSLGRGSGAWDGVSGIKSSSAAASVKPRTVGWLDNGNGSVTFGYAASGDTNLDWTIDILDVANFVGSGKFDSGLTAKWSDGDFNYDGFADILDVAEMISADLYNVGNYNITPAGTIAAVPEPSTLGLVGFGASVAGLLALRRKRVG